MPTGYAQIILEGATFEQYALRCARAFGAIIMQREESLDSPLKSDIQPDDYYSRQLVSTVTYHSELLGYNDEQWRALNNEAHEKEVKFVSEAKQKEQDEKDRYLSMMEKVNAYVPPTPDHEKYKEFMREQIKISMGSDYYINMPEPVKPSVAEFKQTMLSGAEAAVKRARESYADEVERCAKRKDWIEQMMQSVKEV